MNGQPARPNNAIEQEQSPLWRGCRVSVIIPTYNRMEKLLRCLDALNAQSILPQEFEVLVIDDGSADGTDKALQSAAFPFQFQYFRQQHAGPGAARNLGIARAQGELVLFIGDDIIADERLLENHLLAHAQSPEQSVAVLGYIAWPKWLKPNAVMEYVTGESGLQFGYPLIERGEAVDHRFFYTSNISLKRSFLLQAAEAGIRFDPVFRHYGFEDIEYAYRLRNRGLTIQYWKDAIAYHDHWMDLESFARRQYLAGQMSVVFYRKHPGLVGSRSLAWINDWTAAVERLSRQPELSERVQAAEKDMERSLHSLSVTLESLLDCDLVPPGPAAPELQPRALRGRLERLLETIFSLETTRGQVQEWYANVEDPRKVEIAKSLISCFKVTEFFNPPGGELQETAFSSPVADRQPLPQAHPGPGAPSRNQPASALQQIVDAWAPPASLRRRILGRLSPILLAPWTIRRALHTRQQAALIRSTSLFNAAWYLSHNPDVAQAGVDPAEHYLGWGAFEGRDPGPEFSSSTYLAMYPDVGQAGLNPLVHYLKYGAREGRVASPSIAPRADGSLANDGISMQRNLG